MQKFNKKFNNTCIRCKFWHELEQHFIEFQNLLKPNNYLTHEDKKTLFKIHSLLFECYKTVKNKKKFHLDKLQALLN